MKDLLHPFRPSGSFVIEAYLEGRRQFFTGSEEDFSEVDRQLTEKVEGLDDGDYYKKIRSFT